MTYGEALTFIHSTNKFGSKLGLENIKALLKALGHPEKALKFVHVAGTNGKGSTSAMLHEVLKQSGYKVGLYTSPYIECFEERMRVNGVYIEPEVLGALTGEVKGVIDEMTANGLPHPTEFEVVTAIAMLYFKRQACDVVVLEVGLGGRLDATNAIETPLVSVITPIALDHMQYLGTTLEAIAGEKAGIIKDGGITVTQRQVPEVFDVIQRTADAHGNTLYVAKPEMAKWLSSGFEGTQFEYDRQVYTLKFSAPYQVENAVLALTVIDVLRREHGFNLPQSAVISGLAQTLWPGRMECISATPKMIVDGAHNQHGIEGLVQTIKAWGGQYEILGVIGVLADKEVEAMMTCVAPYIQKVMTTRPDIYRALSAHELADKLSDFEVLYASDDVEAVVSKAFEWALEKPDKRVVLGFGSLYMLGDIKRSVRKRAEKND